MSATAPILFPCRCGAKVEARYYAAHLKHCQVAQTPPPRIVETLDDIDLHPRSAYETRRMHERWRSQDIDQALWDRELRPALDVWINEGGRP